MKKYIRRMSSFILAVVMMMTIALPAMAADLPEKSDTATIAVEGIESGATVTAYRIVKPIYMTGGGYSGYEPEIAGTIAGVKDGAMQPTAEEVFKLSQRTKELSVRAALTEQADGSYAASVGAGTWMVLVEGGQNSLEKVYNPVMVSASYKDNLLVGTVVDAGTSQWKLQNGTTVAKATEPTIEKTIVIDGSEIKGDDTAIGDTIHFKAESQIPSYGASYTDLTYRLTDNLSEGLTLNKDSVSVKVNGLAVAPGANTYGITFQGTNGYTIDFTGAYVRANGQKAVEVTYSAVLNEKASSGFDADTNTMKLDYSTKFNGETSAKEDITRHYTFGIDASITGQSGLTTITKTHEMIKVAADKYVEKNYTDQEYTVGVPGALKDAEFTLYKDNNGSLGEKVATSVSTGTGHMEFTGLDAGSYIIKETKAPSGYQLDDTEHTVVIRAEYNEDGTLKSYTITIDGKATNTYSASYNGVGAIQEIRQDKGVTSIFKNTKIGQLPSTGGMGTYLFTIAGVCIMAAAAGILLVRRKHT